MGRYPDGPTPCLKDAACQVRITSMRDTGPIVIFSFWGAVIFSCGAFMLWKWNRSYQFPIKPILIQEKSSSGVYEDDTVSSDPEGVSKRTSQTEEVHVELEGDREFLITGFTWTYFGEFCYFLSCLVSLHWIALYVLILVDTYNKCEVGGIDNLCFFGNNVIFGTYELNSKVFFVVWWLSTFWFTAWVLNKGRVHNFFRVPCDLSRATVVYVWAKDQREVLSINVFFLVRVLQRVKNTLIPAETRGHFEIIDISSTSLGQRYFFLRGQRYLVNGEELQRAFLNIGTRYSDFFQVATGLTSKEAESRLEKVGFNEIPFKPETLMFIVVDELFSLFHVYQLVIYMLQFWNSYLFVASLMICIVLLSASVTIYSRRRSQLAIAKVTEYVTETLVLRDGEWTILPSRKLVPGDLVKIRSDWLLPCDLLIIKGFCVCNESALTGEAMPVQKYMASNNLERYRLEGHGSRHTLFSGTTVLQAGNQRQDDVLAIVTSTGMATSKGELLASILYPEKMLFKYDEELPIVVLMLLAYGIICFIISIFFQTHTGAQSYWVTKWIYCMAILNQIISPLLPVALEVGQLHAVERLKVRGIFCLNPKRIAIAGKIRVFCFDKTGTLTNEGLDFIGAQSVVRSNNFGPAFGPLKTPANGDDIEPSTLHGLATCHAVTKFGDRFVGNQVEVMMFSSVGWELVENANEAPCVRSVSGKELRIVKRNEFDHARTTMSVVVQDKEGLLQVYCKGSFEKIRELSAPHSLPTNYMHTARQHALDGCYVLGLGYRNLGSDCNLERVEKLSRDDLEKDLEFVALILFRNELKPDSRNAIETLKAGEVRPVMVTGDNAQCGHYIAKQCMMVAPDVRVLLGDIDTDGSVSWRPMSVEQEGYNTRPLSTEELLRDHTKGLEAGLQELAVTGRAFTVLRRSEAMERLLYFTRIYARFTPADKVLVANMHRDCGLIVGMCGDGGNDCGALRTAHAGIALSEAEASVVSPFTSQDKSVASVVELLREGRGALHTSFACYKFLITYGLMFSILKLCAYWYGIILCQMDYIFIDGVAVLSLGYAMTLSYPEDKLAKVRPTSSLLGPQNVASVVGVWVINLLYLIGALGFMVSHTDYVKWPAVYSHGASWWTLGDNWESTVIFFVMYFQFITSAFVFTFGSVFRKNVFKNWFLVGSYGGLLVFMSALLLLSHSGFTSLWHVASEQFNKMNSNSPVWIAYQAHGGSPSSAMPFKFRFQLWWLIMTNLVVIIVWQKIFAEGPVAKAFANRFPSQRQKFCI
ncbi:hypothetical protein KC19_2G011200 [Ceratodon purpureus]|nr:hypothetical protein KC19_2G011200 [Ceratodon purpureus]KAG0585434.1 hypothetical protein KC19_2G011200 [Ceratodon purpureus]KAG0585435.1 hypothetical protein KC19_2G011200 [Ceratodon purpureus]